MIDSITINSTVGEVEDTVLSRFDQLTIKNNVSQKLLPTKTYLLSPLTNAQIEVTPSLVTDEGSQRLSLKIKIPVAAALAGQNIVHNGLEAIKFERKGIAKLVRWILMSFRFDADQIAMFIKHARTLSMELTWHTVTASPDAARKLQIRTIEHFRQLHAIKGRHDIQLRKWEARESSGRTLLATFKDRSAFRQYLKVQQDGERTKHTSKVGFVSKAMRAHLGQLNSAVENHVRNEAILSMRLIEKHNLLRPGGWTEQNLAAAISELMTMAGLNSNRLSQLQDVDVGGLSDAIIATAKNYFAGNRVQDELSAQVFSKHRTRLLERRVDIALPLPHGRTVSTARAGSQIQFEKRWVPPSELAKFGVGEASAPSLLAALATAKAALAKKHEQDDESPRSREI